MLTGPPPKFNGTRDIVPTCPSSTSLTVTVAAIPTA